MALRGDTSLLKQVLSMETTQNPDSWRSITGTFPALLAGGLFMLAHWLSGIASLYASVLVGRSLNDTTDSKLSRAKQWVTIGIGIACFSYMFGFVAFADAWFQLWQSETINYVPHAQRTLLCYLLVLVYSKHVD